MKAKYEPLKDDPCYICFDKTKNDEYFFDEEGAIIKLLQDEVCFCGSIWHPDKPWHPKQEGYSPDNFLAIGIYVNCNDVFYWAQAEGEHFGFEDLEDLYRAHVLNPQWGSTIWACKHRNLQPQVPVKKEMIKDGAWNDELEALPCPEPS